MGEFTLARGEKGFIGTIKSPPASHIKPLMTPKAQAHIAGAAQLPNVNAAGTNLLNTQGQGNSTVPANRHFNLWCGDYGEFFKAVGWLCLNINYEVKVEHIDGTYTSLWDDNVKDLCEGTPSFESSKGQAEFNFILRVGDKIHMIVTAAGAGTEEEIDLTLSDRDAPRSVLYAGKVLANGLKVNVAHQDPKFSNLLNLGGTFSDFTEGNTIELEYTVVDVPEGYGL
tara:strand:- start:106 stop:783 length:678 start_codon:yes stop_codon:yes gene_type:complete